LDSRIWLLLGGAGLVGLLYMTEPFVSITVYSIFIYYIARPMYRKLHPKLKSKTMAAFVSIFAITLPIVLIVMYTIGVASIEMQNFIRTTDIPTLQSSTAMINEAGKIVQEINLEDTVDLLYSTENMTTKIIQTLSGHLGSLVWNIVSSALTLVFKLFLVFLISFYLLVDGSSLRGWAENTVFQGDKQAHAFLHELDDQLANIFSGNILTAGVIAVIGAVLFTIVNNLSAGISIPYPVLLGILCGLASLIPVVGVSLVWAPLAIYLAAKKALEGLLPESIAPLAVFAGATYLIVDWLPNMLLRPRMTGRKMHKGLLLLSYIFGPVAFGLKGLFLGPMILVFTVNFAKMILPSMLKKN